MSDIFLSVLDIIFPSYFLATSSSLEISLQDIFFFWNHPYPPQKSNGLPLESTKHLLNRKTLICDYPQNDTTYIREL